MLVGLSSLYALVLAAVGYLNVQSSLKELGKKLNDAGTAVDEAKDHLEKAKHTSDSLDQKFNTFTHVDENVKDLRKSVSKVLPDTELEGGIEQAYDSLSGDAKERIYFDERSLAFARFITSEGSEVVDEQLSMALARSRQFQGSEKEGKHRIRSGRSPICVDSRGVRCLQLSRQGTAVFLDGRGSRP